MSLRFAAAVSCFCALIAISACDRASDPAPVAAAPAESKQAPAPPSQPALTGPPQITFDSLTHDFGKISETQPQTAVFHFTNTGGETLHIQQVKVTCGCTSPKLAKREYQPGERGQIEVTFTPTGPGKDPKIINVITNAPPSSAGGDPFVRLLIHADVQAFIDVQPPKLDLGVLAYRQPHTYNVTVDCPPDENFVLESVTTTNPHVTAKALPPTAGGRSRTIAVTVEPTAAWGPLFAWLEVSVRGRPQPDAEPITHSSKTRVQGQVFGQLRASPLDTFRFGVKPGEPFERTIQITRTTGEPFEVNFAMLADCDLPGAAVTAVKRSPNSYDIIFRGVGDRIRAVHGVVRLTTNVPGEEHIDLPIVGVVRIDNPSVR